MWDPGEGTWDPAGAVLVGMLNRVNCGEAPSPAPDLANPMALSRPDRVQGAIQRMGQASTVPSVSYASPFDIFSSSGILS